MVGLFWKFLKKKLQLGHFGFFFSHFGMTNCRIVLESFEEELAINIFGMINGIVALKVF